MNSNYKKITVQDIVDAVLGNPETYPLGMNTLVLSGDFECNYTHRLHELMHQKDTKLGKCICLAYEMHEGAYGEE